MIVDDFEEAAEVEEFGERTNSYPPVEACQVRSSLENGVALAYETCPEQPE